MSCLNKIQSTQQNDTTPIKRKHGSYKYKLIDSNGTP